MRDDSRAVAFPPVNFRAVCLVRAIGSDDSVGMDQVVGRRVNVKNHVEKRLDGEGRRKDKQAGRDARRSDYATLPLADRIFQHIGE